MQNPENPSLAREQRKVEKRRKPRLVEVGRDSDVRTDVPCPQNPHVRLLSWRMARIEACGQDRGVYVMRGITEEDHDALPAPSEVTWADVGYRGSHDLLHGHVAAGADWSSLAKRINHAIDEVMEQYVEEREA
jgi:hypothetical protein